MRPETVQLLKNLGWGVLTLSVCSGLVYGAWHLVRLPSLTIDQVVVTGGETISHQAIQANVEQQLEGTYGGFIPRRFTLTYPAAEISSVVAATPRVKDPVVARAGRTVTVVLAEFEPVGLWCDGVASGQTGSTTTAPCVFLDENGYGFALAPDLAGGTFTRFTRVGQSASASGLYADTLDFGQLRELEDLLTQYSWPVDRIELDQARDAFVHLVGGGELKVALGLTPTQTLDNLQAVLGAEQYQDLGPGGFEYIDLRFGNKVFVNQFGAPVDEVASTTVATSTTETETAASDDTAGE